MIADDKKDKEAIVMSKRLVAFFSASGNTKKIAQTLAEAAGADRGANEEKLGADIAQCFGVGKAL